MSRAKTLQESVWITSIIIPPKVRVRRKQSIIPLFLESPHHLLVPNRIVRWLERCHVEKMAPGGSGFTAPRGKRRKDLGNNFWWVGESVWFDLFGDI